MHAARFRCSLEALRLTWCEGGECARGRAGSSPFATLYHVDLNDELDERRLLKSREVCALLSISARTLWSWQEKGQIPYYKIGGSVRFKLTIRQGWGVS